MKATTTAARFILLMTLAALVLAGKCPTTAATVTYGPPVVPRSSNGITKRTVRIKGHRSNGTYDWSSNDQNSELIDLFSGNPVSLAIANSAVPRGLSELSPEGTFLRPEPRLGPDDLTPEPPTRVLWLLGLVVLLAFLWRDRAGMRCAEK